MMNIICIDDKPLLLNMTVEVCEKMPQRAKAVGFSRAADALLWLQKHTADIVLLDTEFSDMRGLDLAVKIREMHRDIAMILIAGHSEYAVEAFRLHAAGYLMKPVSQNRLAEEIAHAAGMRGGRGARKERQARVSVHTFGEFDVFIDGRAVAFPRSKSKELLAYLIDRQGGGIKRATAAAVLWEDLAYDRSMQKQLDVIIRSLRAALAAVGAADIFEVKNGTMRILPEKIDCDLYRFLVGDSAAVNAYRGEYMSAYSWASLTEAFLTRTQNRIK